MHFCVLKQTKLFPILDPSIFPSPKLRTNQLTTLLFCRSNKNCGRTLSKLENVFDHFWSLQLLAFKKCLSSEAFAKVYHIAKKAGQNETLILQPWEKEGQNSISSQSCRRRRRLIFFRSIRSVLKLFSPFSSNRQIVLGRENDGWQILAMYFPSLSLASSYYHVFVYQSSPGIMIENIMICLRSCMSYSGTRSDFSVIRLTHSRFFPTKADGIFGEESMHLYSREIGKRAEHKN